MVITMKKYYLNTNLIKDQFDDGEIMLYNNLTDEIHILNLTAYKILNLLLDNDDIITVKNTFVLECLNNNPEMCSVEVEEDFDATTELLFKKGIIKKI